MINASHNTFNISVTGDADAEACGIWGHSGIVNATGNTFNLNSTGMATGVEVDSSHAPAVVNIKDNIFNFNAPTIRHEDNNGGIINDLGGNRWNNSIGSKR